MFNSRRLSFHMFSCRCSGEQGSFENMKSLAVFNSEIESFCKSHNVVKVGSPILSFPGDGDVRFPRITVMVEYKI